MDPRRIQRVWFGGRPADRLARAALLPLGVLYGAGVAVRGRLYDWGALRSELPVLPALSVGNLTVGGTGKTPVAAELARRLIERGARPAVVLRGYGGDEPLVHAQLNPTVPVVVAADRLAGVAEARAQGADLAILDDAMQHRRARRQENVVLVSADAWHGGARLPLPAGPWREPLSGLRRATLAVITAKVPAGDRVEQAVRAVRATAPALPTVVARLVPGALRRLDGPEQRAWDSLHGLRAVAIAGIGEPGAFLGQLEAAGLTLDAHVFPDHHPYDQRDAAALARAGEQADLVLCTLKDAVKLAPLWPRAARRLWYVSQAVRFEAGEPALDALLSRLLAYRDAHTQPRSQAG